MKKDGAYSLLEPEDLEEGLSGLNERFEDFQFLDSRVSTFSYSDVGYNGALIVAADEEPGRFEKEQVIGNLAEEYGWSSEEDMIMRTEGHGLEHSYYSIADSLGREQLH